MMGMEEQDHYDLLEISRNATTADVERAYRLSQQTYGEGSLATYSIFEDDEATAIREQLDEAYRILSNPEFRSAYDEDQPIDPATASSGFSFDDRAAESQSSVVASEATDPSFGDINGTNGPNDAIEEYDVFEDEGGGDFDGVRLRRTRLFRGYEIEDIAEVTKVSRTHLRNIEDENFVDLPADVYVRGFVTAYATTIGLDPKAVVPSYMTRVQESRSGNQRGRFLDRT